MFHRRPIVPEASLMASFSLPLTVWTLL